MLRDNTSLRVVVLPGADGSLLRGHLAFKEWLESEVRAGAAVDVEKLKPPQSSALGQWLWGEAQIQFGSLPQFHALRQSVADFHLVCAAIVGSIQRNAFPSSAQTLKGIAAYESASRDIAMALHAFRQAIETA